nr:unnamed protein product [Callosobruchus analis]
MLSWVLPVCLTLYHYFLGTLNTHRDICPTERMHKNLG